MHTGEYSLVPRPSVNAEGGSGEYSTKFLNTTEFRRQRSDWSIRVTRYSHPLFPTQTRDSSYRLYSVSGTVCLGVYKRQGPLAVGTILASLLVRTTAGLFRVGGRDLGVLEAESLALLFVQVVLVDVSSSEAEKTAEVTRVRR